MSCKSVVSEEEAAEQQRSRTAAVEERQPTSRSRRGQTGKPATHLVLGGHTVWFLTAEEREHGRKQEE